jgi:hypothetical protein
MDFIRINKISGLLSKDYAEEFLRLLVIYKNISASEAASRLDMHIKTAQDFLEGLESLGILEKYEVYEKTRPYFRYKLIKEKIDISIDLSKLNDTSQRESKLKQKIKEKIDSGVSFIQSSEGQRIAAINISTGIGRDQRFQKLNLTENQGKFLFHLPFPTEDAREIKMIIKKAEINESFVDEILDLVELLKKHNILKVT